MSQANVVPDGGTNAGFYNAGEYAAYLQGQTILDLDHRVAGGGLVLTWPTILARTYQMQYTTNLAQPNWSAVGRPQVGTGGPLGFTNTTLPAGFYRLQVIR